MEVDTTSRKLALLSITFLCGLKGVWSQLLMPQTSMDVKKGEMVVLRVSYSSVPGGDLSTNTILWNFVSNSTQLFGSITQPISSTVLFHSNNLNLAVVPVKG